MIYVQLVPCPFSQWLWLFAALRNLPSLHCLFCEPPRKGHKLLAVPVSGFGPEGPGLTAAPLLTWTIYACKDRKQNVGCLPAFLLPWSQGGGATSIVLRQQWPPPWRQVGLGLVGTMGFSSAVYQPLQWYHWFWGRRGFIMTSFILWTWPKGCCRAWLCHDREREVNGGAAALGVHSLNQGWGTIAGRGQGVLSPGYPFTKIWAPISQKVTPVMINLCPAAVRPPCASWVPWGKTQSPTGHQGLSFGFCTGSCFHLVGFSRKKKIALSLKCLFPPPCSCPWEPPSFLPPPCPVTKPSVGWQSSQITTWWCN